jgi:molybdopterin/thiamine biosynthesis adenylyltransferase
MSEYEELTDRNIGIITDEQQKKLKGSCVAIFGVGGLGGIIAEIICRSGVGHVKIIEPDSFDPSNLNRHVFCYRSTVGKKKIDVAEKHLKDIYSEVKIDKYLAESPENIDEILRDVDVVVLAVDKVKACILVSREAKKQGIPLVEGWALPYGNVRVFTQDTMSLEQAYNLPSINKELDAFTHEDFAKMDLSMLQTISQFEGVTTFYTKEAEKRIFIERKNPSFAPLVWLNSALMSLEAIKILIGAEKLSLAPAFALYDPFFQRIPRQTP